MDRAHDMVDARIAVMEDKIRRVYRKAYIDTRRKLREHLESFGPEDEAMRAQVDAGEITMRQYERWRRDYVMLGERWEKMADVLAKDFTRSAEIAASIVNENVPWCFALNHDYGFYEIESGFGFEVGYTLYDRKALAQLVNESPNLLPMASVDEGEHTEWMAQKVTEAVTQGLLTGDTIPELAKRMEQVAAMSANASVRTARTAMTAAENMGRQASYERAQSMGIRLKKEWVATLDNRTRESHRKLMGKVVDVGAEFMRGLEYPGDPHGRPEEVYNCRCTMVTRLEGFEDPGIIDLKRIRIDGLTFEEWLAMKDPEEKMAERAAAKEARASGKKKGR